MSVQIIVDSTVDMPERMKDRFRIVPLTVHFGAEEFIDGVTIDKHRFYERLVESDELPTTSHPRHSTRSSPTLRRWATARSL